MFYWEAPAKKTRYFEAIPSSFNLEPENQHVASCNDLPPEMHEMILRNVSTIDLLNCRMVNRQWNQISSRIIRERDFIIKFVFVDGKYIRNAKRGHCRQCSIHLCTSASALSNAKSLNDLVDHLKDSPHLPFTSFRFNLGTDIKSLIDLRKFLDIWGSNILSLKLTLPILGTALLELLTQVPNLKKITLLLPAFQSSQPPPTADLHFPKLEYLCVNNTVTNHKILENILIASPNLKTFSIFKRALLPTDFETLHKLGKLHCLQDIPICITEDLIAYWKKSPDHFAIKLRSLVLSFDDSIYLNNQLNSSASEIINELFYSSRNTMQTLVIEPLGPLGGLVFPKFERLQQLCLRQELSQKDYTMLPLLFDWAGKFPYVKELDIELKKNALDQLFDHSLKVLPSIEILRVSWQENRDIFGELIKRTPNVKTLSIKDDNSFQLNEDHRFNLEDVSTYLPKLENFSWHIIVSKNSRSRMDALLTGLPENFCKKLAKKFRDQDHLPIDEISRYWKPCNSSIVDLSALRNLHLRFDKSLLYNFYTGNDDEIELDPKNSYYETGFTEVSAFLVFNQMPNLSVTFHKKEI